VRSGFNGSDCKGNTQTGFFFWDGVDVTPFAAATRVTV
jgi:hypothetical protein